MSEYFPSQPSLDQLMSEFQTENDVLGILDAYRCGLVRRADEMKQLAQNGGDSEWAEGEVKEIELSANDHAPIAPYMEQVWNTQILRLYQYRYGMRMPGSGVSVATNEANSDKYIVEPGFTDEQVDVLLNQLTRFILFSRQQLG